MRARGWTVVQVVCVLALSVGALTASACKPVKRVLVIGDSLTVGAQQQGLGREHPATWIITASEGLGTNAGIDLAEERDIASFDLVIIALGTNDYLDTKAAYAVRIDKMMAVLGSKVPVVWVNVDAATRKLAPAANGVNPALAGARSRHPNLQLADWASYLAGRADRNELRRPDGVHYTTTGYAVRARWVESFVAS